MKFQDVCTVVPASLPAGHSSEFPVSRYQGHISDTWTVGRKVHGGTLVAASAAAGLQMLRDTVPDADGMFPIATSTDFHGAPDPGDMLFDVTIRKTGRQICLADVALVQGDRVLARTALTFGHLDDEVVYQGPDLEMPAEPTADAVVYDQSSAEGRQMTRILHLAEGCELRLDRTSAAFLHGGTGEPSFRLWARPLESDAADPDTVALFALMAADISPPVPMNIGHFGWSPTIQLTAYLRRRPAPGWLRVMSSTSTIGGRLFDEDHLVLDQTGAVVAQSRQLAMIPKR